MKKISDKMSVLIIIGIVLITIFAMSYVINQFFYKDTTWFRNLNIIEKLGDIWAQHLWKIVVTLILGPTFFVYRRRKKNKKEKEKSWVKRHPRWTSFIVVVMIGFLPPSGPFLYDLNHPTSINQVSEKKDQKKENNEQEIPFSTTVIGIFLILLTASLYARNITNQRTEKRDSKGKILVPKKEWGEILKSPMMVVLYVVLGVNLLFSILIPILWSFFWSDQILFWSINLGAIFLALLKTRKDKNEKVIPHFQIAAKVFGTILAIGLVAQLARNPYWHDGGENGADNKNWFRSVFSKTPKFVNNNRGYIFGPEHMKAEVALKVIGSCESTGAPNNDPVHTEKDGDKDVLLKNKQRSKARGMYQFMPDHWDSARKIDLDLEKKEDYVKYAIDLYNRTGTKHWQFDSDKGGGEACWGNALLGLAQEKDEFEIEIIAPPKINGDIARVNIFGYKVSWDGSEEGFIIKADDGRTAEFSKEKKEALFGKNTDTLTFNSTDDKTKMVKIKFTKIKT